MGFLKLFSKPVAASPKLERPPEGAVAVARTGAIIVNTLPSGLLPGTVEQIGRTVLLAFEASGKINAPLSELAIQYEGLRVVARESRGGAVIFFHPTGPVKTNATLPAMSNNSLSEFILYLETYIECWKQFNYYVNLARIKKFTTEDEAQFLEIKSLITQGLEVIADAVEQGCPRKDEVMVLITSAPSIRHLAERENTIGTVESQWHKAFLTLQSLLGRLKVQQQKQEGDWSWGSLFGKDR